MLDRASILKRQLLHLYEDEELAEVLQEVFAKKGQSSDFLVPRPETLPMLVSAPPDSPWLTPPQPKLAEQRLQQDRLQLEPSTLEAGNASTAAPDLLPPSRKKLRLANRISSRGWRWSP